MLPDESGVSLWRRLVASRPGLRVTFMSGYTGEPHGGELPDDAHFLAKPFKPEALLSTVRESLDA